MIQRKVQVVPPFYCHPDHGCRDLDCGGRRPGAGNNHGVGTDEWYFTVVHPEHGYALTLSVYGTELHPGVRAGQPSRPNQPGAGTASACAGRVRGRSPGPPWGSATISDGAGP